MIASALYVGVVSHARLRPRRHALRYRVFMLLLDLDSLEPTRARLRLLARGRFGLVSFRETDHGDGSAIPLKEQIGRLLIGAGIEAGGPVGLLCMPRVLGYGFNPLSLYFCHRADGRLAAIVYEVTNTFGERHSYVIPCETGDGAVVRQTAPKRLYVSPFMDMGLSYRFAVRPPGEAVRVGVDVDDDEGLLLTTSFAGERRPLTDAGLLRAWAAHPLLTLKVIAAIHWEALRLWRKRIGVRRRPAVPASPTTLGRSTGEAA